MERDQTTTPTIDRTRTGEATSALDEALDSMGATDFELPNGFVNHGPMACEALDAMGCDDQVSDWARWFVQMVGHGPQPTEPSPVSDFEGLDALGRYGRLPEWVGYFERAIALHGWERTVELWVPRLIPGMATALFHGVIRTAHAVRAIDTVDTAPRQAELARALGYWAGRFQPGRPVSGEPPGWVPGSGGEARRAVIEAAAAGARHYVVQPTIFNLHGVTGAMAVALLIDHIAPEQGADAVAQVRAEHGALYGGRDLGAVVATADRWDESLVPLAAHSRDAHQVKLVEACRRGWEATGDSAFTAAARRVSA